MNDRFCGLIVRTGTASVVSLSPVRIFPENNRRLALSLRIVGAGDAHIGFGDWDEVTLPAEGTTEVSGLDMHTFGFVRAVHYHYDDWGPLIHEAVFAETAAGGTIEMVEISINNPTLCDVSGMPEYRSYGHRMFNTTNFAPPLHRDIQPANPYRVMMNFTGGNFTIVGIGEDRDVHTFVVRLPGPTTREYYNLGFPDYGPTVQGRMIGTVLNALNFQLQYSEVFGIL